MIKSKIVCDKFISGLLTLNVTSTSSAVNLELGANLMPELIVFMRKNIKVCRSCILRKRARIFVNVYLG
jgi:hypothetical protein